MSAEKSTTGGEKGSKEENQTAIVIEEEKVDQWGIFRWHLFKRDKTDLLAIKIKALLKYSTGR